MLADGIGFLVDEHAVTAALLKRQQCHIIMMLNSIACDGEDEGGSQFNHFCQN